MVGKRRLIWEKKKYKQEEDKKKDVLSGCFSALKVIVHEVWVP